MDNNNKKEKQSNLEPLLELATATFTEMGLDLIGLDEARKATQQSTSLTVAWGLHQLASQPNAEDIKQGATCRKHISTILNNYEDALKDVPSDLVKRCQALVLIDTEAKAADAPVASAPLADAEAAAPLAEAEAAAEKANDNVAKAGEDGAALNEPESKRRKVEGTPNSKGSPAKLAKTIKAMSPKKGRGGGRGGKGKGKGKRNNGASKVASPIVAVAK